MLWYLPKDFAHFKQTTLNKKVLMGRKTWESLPTKPLPQRQNIILSRRKIDFSNLSSQQLASQIYSLDELWTMSQTEEILIIGGANLYQQLLPACKKIYLTQVKAHFEADAFFPTLNWQEWQQIDKQFYPADTKHRYAFDILTLVKKPNRI